MGSINTMVKQFMDYMGTPESRLVTGHVQAYIVYGPNGSDCGRNSLLNIQHQSLFFRNTLGSFRGPPQGVIVLVRRSRKRWFKNHSSIVLSLKVLSHLYNLRVEVFSDTQLPSLEAVHSGFPCGRPSRYCWEL